MDDLFARFPGDWGMPSLVKGAYQIDGQSQQETNHE